MNAVIESSGERLGVEPRALALTAQLDRYRRGLVIVLGLP